jgi:hypothetical protein
MISVEEIESKSSFFRVSIPVFFLKKII